MLKGIRNDQSSFLVPPSPPSVVNQISVAHEAINANCDATHKATVAQMRLPTRASSRARKSGDDVLGFNIESGKRII